MLLNVLYALALPPWDGGKDIPFPAVPDVLPILVLSIAAPKKKHVEFFECKKNNLPLPPQQTVQEHV